MSRCPAARATNDYGAIVIGAGHNGLVCAAYLAKAGRRTLLVEARDGVGGTAASEAFGGAMVNICNCDRHHVSHHPRDRGLGLADHGLRYIDVDPAGINMSWAGGPAWLSHHDLEAAARRARPHLSCRDRRLPALRRGSDASRADDLRPTPTSAHRARHRRRHRPPGRWAERAAAMESRSAPTMMREFFTARRWVGRRWPRGPMVWGISPETPGTGLGAMTYAIRHVGRLGSSSRRQWHGAHTLQKSFAASGGELRLST